MMILLLFSRHKEPSVFSKKKTNKQQQQTTTNIQDTQVQFLEMQNIVAQRPFFQALTRLVLVIFRGLFIIKV